VDHDARRFASRAEEIARTLRADVAGAPAQPLFLGDEDFRIPAVASFHTRFDTYAQYYGVPGLQSAIARYLARFYAKCEHVYVPCESMGDELRRDGLADNLRIWSRGVDFRVFTPDHRSDEWRAGLGFKQDDVVIAFVGRLVLEKGLEMFAQSLAELRKRGVAHKVLVVGEGPQQARLARWVPDAVFAGFQKDLALGRAYASSDIFFNPSITETFGNVTLEAMAAGLPAVCADATGSRSLVEHGDNGFVANPSDPSDFADGLEKLATDAARRRAMGRSSLAKAKAFDWTTILDGLLHDYKTIVCGEAIGDAADTGQSPVPPQPADADLAPAA